MDSEDNFMKVFKYYKSNKPKPSFSNVMCLESDDVGTEVIKFNIQSYGISKQTNLMGLQNPVDWNVFSFINHPGLIFIRNPFTTSGQRYWVRKCLKEYTRKPNKTNLDIEKYIEDWWSQCRNNGKYDIKLVNKLRWTTLGYHHNWNTKEYSEENKNEFPKDLAELCDIISKIVGFEDFKAEAAIVNYYHMGSTLSAHTDHSEPNLAAPLFSFSFGQSAIFLIGGQDKSIKPTPILLNSGDIIVMSKEARLCYHAVPRIIPSSTQPWKDATEFEPLSHGMINKKVLDDGNWDMFSKYVEQSRININVRQVLNKNQHSLNDVIY